MKLLEPLLNKIQPTALIRIKANSYPNTHIIQEHKMHTDMNYGMTSIFYLNTNDGYTKFDDGTVIESVQNRLLTFSKPNHTCTLLYIKHKCESEVQYQPKLLWITKIGHHRGNNGQTQGPSIRHSVTVLRWRSLMLKDVHRSEWCYAPYDGRKVSPPKNGAKEDEINPTDRIE